MNMIDSIIIEDALRDSNSEGRQNKARAILNKEYGRISSGSHDQIPDYVEPTEDGYDFGFDLPPMG